MCNFRVIKRMLCPNESDQEIAPITTILKFIGVTLAVISFIFVFFLLNHVLGILGTLIIHNNHDISTGCPKTNPQNCDSAEKTMCNFGSNAWNQSFLHNLPFSDKVMKVCGPCVC